MSIVALNILSPTIASSFRVEAGLSGVLRSWNDKVPRDLARGMKEFFGEAALSGN